MEKKQGPYSRTHQLISFKTEGPTALLLLQSALLVCFGQFKQYTHASCMSPVTPHQRDSSSLIHSGSVTSLELNNAPTVREANDILNKLLHRQL